jgi:hypothetical protein
VGETSKISLAVPLLVLNSFTRLWERPGCSRSASRHDAWGDAVSVAVVCFVLGEPQADTRRLSESATSVSWRRPVTVESHFFGQARA